MNEFEGYWEFDGNSSQRLWEKSALGTLTKSGTLLLTPSEALFCINHRNLDLSETNWLEDSLSNDESLLDEYAILEALRVPGNKIVLGKNISKMGYDAGENTWALRWPSDKHPSKDDAISEVIYFHSDDKFDERQLYDWCELVTSRDRVAEVLVVDQEQSVVTYRLHISDLKGDLQAPDPKSFQKIANMEHHRISSGGAFFPNTNDWPLDVVGIPLHGGRQVDSNELHIIHKIGNLESNFTNPLPNSGKNLLQNSGLSKSAELLMDLWSRGLNTRSGFKYGAEWRCYSGKVGQEHAPWLVIDPYSQKRSKTPEDWADACLSSRLASGVNKHWICPFYDDETWKYLEVSRPPSDSRWTNPSKK